jgi:CBS-domain-containing membrane protein
VVFHNPNNTFFGMIDARKLLALLENQRNDLAFANLANLINRGSLDDRAQLAKLPGFVPAADAVTSNTNKRDVLLKMDEKNTDWLPVLTSDGNLQGIVDRSRLLASLIIDIANELEAATPKQ